QETAGSFSLCGMKLRSLLALTFCSSIAFGAVPAQAEECPDGICELVFEYTGNAEYFTVPDGAKNVSFEISGAAGGRGGMGGRVTGEFINSPNGFWVFVGGEGVINAEAPGGYNGGGRAGGSRGNEGSGGGASDIRSGTNLNDRIVVAGGGGGGGGYAGAAGGAGGNLIAENGGSGQGSGGGGGRESSGGSAGSSNGGSSAQPGGFGVGGTGGSSWNAGGGGGGGGWFGGGGGGADDDSCCADAGGGGGGSSYANTSLVTNINHQAGVQNAAGRVVIRYEVPSKITLFTGAQLTNNQVSISMEVEGSFSPNSTHLEIVDTACIVSEPELTGSTYVFQIQGCVDSAFQASLAPEAAALLIDDTSPSLQIELDLVGPEFTFEQTTSTDHDYVFDLVGSEDHSGFSSEDILVAGCGSTALLNKRLSLNDCQEGDITITIESKVVTDAMGNLGPSEPTVLELSRDTIAPTAQWLEPEITEFDGTFNLVISLRHDDSLIQDAVVEFLADEISCLPVTTFAEGEIAFEYIGCAPGSMSWTLPAFSLIDGAGNSGPTSDSVLEITLVASVPTPEPTPATPEPAPEVAPRQPALQIPSQLAPELPDEIQSPIEAPEFIDQEIVEEILEFVESEEVIPIEKESPPKAVATASTRSSEAVSSPIASKPPLVTPEPEPQELESEATVTNDEEDLLDQTEIPTQSTYVAELASGDQKPAGPDSVARISPWLVGGAIAAVLAFIGYRKMMVR
uniref:glycine-rich protein n=1 Tax=Aquiluna sp. TaxID=2053504 RepID=UPI004048C122